MDHSITTLSAILSVYYVCFIFCLIYSSSQIQAYCTSLIKKMKDSYGCPGDVMVDAHIGAWVGELPDCFKGINSEDNAASDNVQHPYTFSQENQAQLVPINTKMSDLEQNDKTQETLQNIASFQVPRMSYKMELSL